ncbi:M23 family metallopeptidase [Halococcus salsus]|uniref:M23 family metallopeptidase n=1 Tax=Halococcus salsus TaxID=2162894 RepID=UPI001358AB9E|nr:M23 family metallopeptidase [Halococcus salsus]
MDVAQRFTPAVGEVRYAPVPFTGSDGQTYLAYELEVTNFTTGSVTIEKLEVVDTEANAVIHALDADEVASRLQPAGRRDSVGSLGPAMTALVFLHVTVDDPSDVPDELRHRLSLQVDAAPPDQRRLVETVGEVTVDRREVVTVGPPLRGSNYIAADSFGDAVRHTRAALPVDGQVWLAQRYAVDYEQLDTEDRIYDGPREDLESYTIYGEEAIAVADATVVEVIDDVPENVPGAFPDGITLEAADGNAVILDLGDENYALYAHFQPGSIRVAEGDHVERGDVLGLVGNSGNSIAPHLHFHVMNRPLSLASNGLPYLVDSFSILGETPGTAAFDQAEADGEPLAVDRFDPPVASFGTLPLDQIVVDFD